MSQRREDAESVQPEAPDAEAVAEYLRDNPDFLAERPELIAALAPPAVDHGEGVVDMQRFLLDSLRAQVRSLTAREERLLAAAEHAVGNQRRIQQAILALMAARSFGHLIRIVADELPAELGIDAVALCVENADALPGSGGKTGAKPIRPGTIRRLMGATADIVLRDEPPDGNAVFGAGSGRLASHALLRLDLGGDAPAALLGLGSRDAAEFHPDRGTELLDFLGRMLEHCIRRWLAEPH